jgi:cytidyltransferase-like protein
MNKKVFVSGCFDLLHSGHIRFLEEAAAYGDVYVGLGSDRTVAQLKGRPPINTQDERKYMLEALRHVKKCFIDQGSGKLDFVEELKAVAPDIFVVNEDGHSATKAALCRRLGIRYVVLRRNPHANLPARSTTSLRQVCQIPFRLDLAGGWLDQPFVSRHGAGPVLTISLEPNVCFNERSGMASSSRRRAIELWENALPIGNLEKLAKTLFAYENPPGTDTFSGSQDAIGIVFPGLNRLDYDAEYWPAKITSVHDEKILRWLEDHLCLVSLGPRKPAFDVLRRKKITPRGVQALARAADGCWQALLKRDLAGFGRCCRESFEAQVGLFPGMVDADVRSVLKRYRDKAAGWKLSGAGGGGYLVLITQQNIPNSIKLTIRRRGF